MTIPVVDSHTLSHSLPPNRAGRHRSARFAALLAAALAVTACDMGGPAEPESGPEGGEPEPAPQVLGWSEVDDIEELTQNRW